MSEATHILRHAAGSTRLHTIPLFPRLAVLEDQRRRDAFVRAKPTIPLELAEVLGAFRSICSFEGTAQYASDMRALNERRLHEVSGWLTDSGFSDEADERWFNTAEEIFSLYRTEDDQFTAQTFYCEYETCRYSNRIDSCSVVVARDSGGWRSETWSEPTADIEAFYCEASDRWFTKADFTSGETSDDRTICTQWARLNGWWEDDDGYWRSADDDGDDDDDTNNLIPSYHDACRNWSLERARQAPTAYYGLEVELEFQDQDDCERYYEEVGFPTADLTAERDGSLDDNCGLEVISRPFTLADLRDRHNPLREALEEACNWNACEPSPSGYGVHVTTNAQRLAVDHRRRLVDATYDMGHLTAFVAGRKPNRDSYSYSYQKAQHYADARYTAVHARSDGSYEFRVFQGTPDWETVLSYIEYVDALTEWTRNPANPTVGPVGQALFRAWVCVTGDYPALATRFTTTQTREAVACALPLLSRAA